MPTLDLSFTITAIIAVAALASPIATAIINNRYNLKIKTLELKHANQKEIIMSKKNIFESYIRYAGEQIYLGRTYGGPDETIPYGEYCSLAHMYATPEIRHEISNLDRLINQADYDDAQECLERLTPMICKLIEDL